MEFLKRRKVEHNITKISEIGKTPGNVRIQGVVVVKNVKSYKNGFMCKFRIQDDSGNIGMTAWNDTCEKFDKLIVQNREYIVYGMTIKTANPNYEKEHTHEIVLKSSTCIEQL